MSNLKDAVGLCVPYGSFSQFEPEFEPAIGTIWGYMHPKGTPCFNPTLLKDIRNHDAELEANGGRIQVNDAWHDVRYYIAASRAHAFNLGGDLALFMMLIKTRDAAALTQYARMCIDNLYPRIHNYGCSTLTTISMVQGDALGGGFECALTSDVVIAEESAKMGLPEIIFNLFPGMGAYSLLARRIGVRAAEEFILSGRLYTARKLHEIGIVDVVAPDGQGESAVRGWIAANARRRNGLQGVLRARQAVHPIRREELDAIAETWVEAALRLEERDLRMMNWLIRGQSMRNESGEGQELAAPRLAQSA